MVPKQRGAGIRKQPATANFWELKESTEVPLATEKPSAVDAKVAELLGFKADQFRQVVLLPQGRFQEFMLASSTERQAILQTLFQTTRYARITEALVEEEKALKDTMRGTQAEVRQRLAQLGLETVEAIPPMVQAAALRTETLAAEQSVASATLERASAALHEAAHTAERLAEHEAAQTELQRLRGEARLVEARRTELERAQRCASVLPAIQRLEEIQLRLGVLEVEEARLTAALVDREAAFVGAQAALQEAEQHEVRREELRRIIDRLKDLEPKVEALDSARKEAREAALARNHLADLADTQKRKLEASRQELTQRRLALMDARTEAAQEAGREGLLRLVRERLGQREDLDRSTGELLRAEAAQEAAQQVLQGAQEAVRTARERHRLVQERRLAAHAARLARNLLPGEPCPVCGSGSHPHPAQTTLDMPDEAELRRALEAQEDAETTQARAQDAAASRGAAVETARARRQDLLKILGEHAGIELDTLRILEVRHREELERSRAATTGLPASEHLMLQAEEVRNQSEAQLSETHQLLSEVLVQEAAAKTRAQMLEEELLQHLRVPGALSARRRETEIELEASEARLASARTALAPVERALQEARATLRAHRAALEATQSDSWNRSGVVDEALAEAHFHSRADFDLARRTPEEMETLARSLEAHAAEEAAALDRASRAAGQAEGLVAPDLPTLQAERDAAQTRFAQAGAALGRAQAEQALLDRCATDLTQLTRDMSLQDRRFRAVANLARVARGDEGDRVSFERYVQGAILDDVLVTASERLRRMSKQRYALRRATSSPDLRKAGGLQLEITDTHTGRSRAVSSLSGGEGFQASLALALGLSDVVQRHAGGICLDTVFIDEGFGSLDPEALDLALRTLEDLHQGGRLVGLISHLEEVKARIPARLEVIPSPSGSHARFRIE
jgi:exonuclease SbcC